MDNPSLLYRFILIAIFRAVVARQLQNLCGDSLYVRRG